MPGSGYRASAMLAAAQMKAQDEGPELIKTGTEGKTAMQLRIQDQLDQANLAKASRLAMDQAGPSYHSPGILQQPDGRLTNSFGETVSDPGQLENLQRTKLATLGLNPNNGDAGIAQSARAFKGYNPDEQSKDEIQAAAMRNLGDAISKLPPEDRQIAYERAVGVMAGKGTIQIHDMPEWTKGGQDFMMAMQEQKNTQDQIMQGLRNQGTLGVAEAKSGKSGIVGGPAVQQNIHDSLISAINNPNTPPLQRLELITSAEKLGFTAGPGEPVGAPISARAIKTFTAANETLKNTSALADLFVKNPDMNLFFPKTSSAAGGLGNTLLSPQQQQYNVLSSHINDAISNMSGDSSIDKNQLKRLSDQLPSVGDDPRTIGTKLAILRDEAANIKSGIDPSGHVERLLGKPALNAAQQQAAQPVMQPQQAGPGIPPPEVAMQLHPGMTPEQYNRAAQFEMQRSQQSAQPVPQSAQAGPVPTAPSPIQQQPASSFLQPGDRQDYNPDLTARGIL